MTALETVCAIELRNITKRFGSVVANDGINLALNRGEILSLLGENGSGKTTLMNMLAGIYFPDEGEILVEGKPVSIRSPKDSFQYGIGMIHQHYKLVDVFTAAENIVLGLDEGGRLDIKAANAKVKELLTAAGYTQDDIKGFADLKKVADDLQARKAELGVDGAFTSAGMDGSSDWRFKTHLANLPIYYEYKADGIGSTDAIKGTYLDNYKQIWDLYITDSTCDPKLLASKTGNDAVAEFVGKKAVFYQNGTWAYNDVKDLGDDNLGMLPIYIGVEGEENQGLCTGSENFWCVNNTSSEEDIQATLDFLYWCVTSEAGTSAMADKMGFVIPFKKAKDSTNPLITIANQYVADGKTSVDWCFSTMPSEEWKNGVGSALTAYAAGTGDWNAVVTAFVDGWAKEYKLANG